MHILIDIRQTFLSSAGPRLTCQVRAAQHLLSEKGSILDIPREMSACMADGRYMELVKLYRKAHTTYSSSILSKVRVDYACTIFERQYSESAE